MYSPATEKLIKLFCKFPTIGPRVAARFVFYLINSPKENTDELIQAITELKNKTKICPSCFKSFEGENEFCLICSNGGRDKSILCIVEKEMDLETIEKTNKYKGTYFILGGVITGAKENNKEQVEQKTQKLIDKISSNGIKEIILALNPTVEGQNTALFVKRKLEPLKLKVTQLGRGLPTGGELEYADDETLSSAFENRR